MVVVIGSDKAIMESTFACLDETVARERLARFADLLSNPVILTPAEWLKHPLRCDFAFTAKGLAAIKRACLCAVESTPR